MEKISELVKSLESQKESVQLGKVEDRRLKIDLSLIAKRTSNSTIGIDLLDWVEDLDASNCNLSHLPEEVCELSRLKYLRLGHNSLKSLPSSIQKLKNLKVLDLNYNSLTKLPDTLSDLENLEELNLYTNQIPNLPDSFNALKNLEILNWGYNGVSVTPEFFMELKKLRELNLSYNHHITISKVILELEKLESLYLNDDLLSEFPTILCKLQNLKKLEMNFNQLTSLPNDIVGMKNLKILNLNYNKIKDLPISVAQLESLETITLEHNPLVTPPLEIVSKGTKAIREYLHQIEIQGYDYLYEAKLLILGEGGAGKTTLAKKIQNPNYALKDEKTTEGIDVIHWTFPVEKQKSFRVNIWDFGGQEIYHTTHQFFLTKRSLYILVVDTRKEDTDFYYWLNVVELLSDNSPLLIVKNEKQDRHREINERLLRGQFSGLKEVVSTNLATNRGLEKLVAEIQHCIRKLPHIGSPLPKTWVRVRELLEEDFD